jgi:hypothetical protein
MEETSEDVMIMSDGAGHPPLTLRPLDACEEMRACMSQQVAMPRHCFRRAKPRSTKSPGDSPLEGGTVETGDAAAEGVLVDVHASFWGRAPERCGGASGAAPGCSGIHAASPARGREAGQSSNGC